MWDAQRWSWGGEEEERGGLGEAPRELKRA